MEWIKEKIKVISKYKYVLLIIVIGLLFMTFPASKKAAPAVEAQTAEEVSDRQELQQILGMVKGAGRVEVYLKKQRSEQYIYQTNTDINTSSDRNDKNNSTVLVTDSDRNQTGLIQTVLTPIYSGAVIVCDGAEDPNVKLAIVDAVSKATGLGSDKISVLKMK